MTDWGETWATMFSLQSGRSNTGSRLAVVGSWYWIGVAAGVGAALGVVCVAVVGTIGRRVLALAAAVGAGLVVGLVLGAWVEAIAGAVGGALGVLGAAPTFRGALERGGTRGGTAALLIGAAVALAALALVPILGYVLAAALPIAGLRARRRSPERYAGLRTLARD